VHESFNTYVAMVAEVSIGERGRFKVERVTAAVDCGVPINPDVIRAQVEGGIGFGLGSVLAEEVQLVGGRVESTNYDAYTPLRIDGMPRVEVHILPSTASPTGIGEPGVPPVGPAVANALAAATGRRIRVLPMSKGAA
jgi:isoquinoline 1-oxidoreductase beta subunit